MTTNRFPLLERLRTSYWFIPAVLSLGAAGLAVLTLILDQRLAGRLPQDVFWLHSGSEEGARTLLGAVVTAMISVTSVVFSITIVALTLASGQFGSRILRTFMRDRGNQVTLGTFIATFVYSLVVLRAVGSGDDFEFVPALSVSMAVLLTFASVGVLIFFIHHVADSIQADSVIDSIATELHEAIGRLFPAALGHAAPEGVRDPADLLPPGFADHAAPVRATASGYLQAVEEERLFGLACGNDLIVRLYHRPGNFVVTDDVLAKVWFEGKRDDSVLRSIRKVFVQGRHRTMQQDAEFGIHQIVEVAVRALSPGVNDPFTAMSCLNQATAALQDLAGRTFPDPARFDEEGRLRIVADTTSFTGFVDAVFNPIRQNAGGSAAVLIRMLESIARIAQAARTDEQRRALTKHARLVQEAGTRTLPADSDRDDLDRRYAAAVRALQD